MKKKIRWRIIVVAVLALICLGQIYPTLRWMSLSDKQRTERQEQWREEDISLTGTEGLFSDMGRATRRWFQGDRSLVINLGLDLQGGIELRYVVDTSAVEKAITEAIETDVAEAEKEGTDIAEVKPEEKTRAINVKEELIVRRALAIIRDRVDKLGTTEPVIQQSGKDRIYIQLPGEKDPGRVKKIIGQTAQLKFQIAAGPNLTEKTLREIDSKLGGRLFAHVTARDGNFFFPEKDKAIVDRLLEETRASGLEPEKFELLFGASPKLSDSEQVRMLYLIEKEVLMTGDKLVSANATLNRESMVGDWEVDFVLNAIGGKEFKEITGDHVQERLAVVLDETVQTAPNINEPIGGGRGRITGGFTPDAARDLAIVLEAGALPAPLELIYEGTVGPTLGRESIRAGIMAALVGFALVVVFMLVYYRLAGIIAVSALLLNVPLILGALAYFHATLTLPGIAGLVLTIGMAVDANVLIFERIREEFKKGKTIRAAIDTGYSRAFLTIIDSNMTTLIAALVLFQFGTGPIKGFAVTLSIGILSSMFTSLFFSRIVFDILTRNTSVKTIKMRTLIGETHVPFVYWRHVALAISVAIILIGMTAFGIRGKDNFGVDFTQGTVMRLKFDQATTTAAVQESLAEGGLADVIIQEYGGGGKEFQGRTFVLRAGTLVEKARVAGETDVSTSDRIGQILGGAEGLPKYELLSVESIGAAVSGELTKQAFLAIINATIAMIIYVSVRFHFKFALGGVIALFHDMAITLGIFALCGREITLPVVAGLLTIMGYSINDTIVIFDRIREDMKLLRGRDLGEVMNISINETLSRTALTSTTTLLAVISLLLLGGPVINDFAFALTVGVVVGTYSSIFVASPAVLMLTKVRGTASARSAMSRGSALMHLFEKLSGSSTSGVTASSDRGRKEEK